MTTPRPEPPSLSRWPRPETTGPRCSPIRATSAIATWRERALNAEEALKAAHAQILTQRTRIGELLGQIRHMQAEWTEEAIQRITTENTTLKQRVRQLTSDNSPSTSASRPPAPISASKTVVSSTSKPASQTRDQRCDPVPLTTPQPVCRRSPSRPEPTSALEGFSCYLGSGLVNACRLCTSNSRTAGLCVLFQIRASRAGVSMSSMVRAVSPSR